MAESQAGVAEMLRENWFWSSIFRDHALFIQTNMSAEEEQMYQWAREFHQSFEQLYNGAAALARSAGINGPAGSYAVAGQPPDAPLARLQGQELLHYEQQAQRTSQAILESLSPLVSFKEDIIQRKLDCKLKLALSPTLVQHMVNEAQEAQRTLDRVRERASLPPALQSLHHHMVWLPDAAGHAAALHAGLDGTERKLLTSTEEFKQIFNGMHIKALELYTMLRVAPRMVGALTRLNQDAVAEIGLFRAFLTELREHLDGCEILNINLAPQLADHMLREELYYTEKLMALK
jgi:hypothetical protein